MEKFIGLYCFFQFWIYLVLAFGLSISNFKSENIYEMLKGHIIIGFFYLPLVIFVTIKQEIGK